MAPSDRALVTVNCNHVSICSGLATIFNGMFQAISGRILETLRDTAKVAFKH